MMTGEPRVLAAEWALPVTAPPIRDAAVVIEGERLAWVGSRIELPSRYLHARMRAWPRSVLLPGFVNAHAHLNLTGLVGQLRGDGDRFADWLRDLIRATSNWTPEIVNLSVAAGLDLLAQSGTTTAAHLSTLPDLTPFFAHPLRAVVFHEAIGFPAAEAGGALNQASRWLEQSRERLSAAPRLSLGLAAHAPYTCSAELIRGLAELCWRERLPFSIHVAETPAEAEFLHEGTGALAEFRRERPPGLAGWRPPGVSPVRYLADLGALQATGAAAHCNYLSEADIARLRSGSLTPVWCPGSHAYFGHARHPAARLLAAGVPVALGTDSLASNVSLDMRREMMLAAASFPDVDSVEWLRAATLTGANALGLGDEIGSLEAGKFADLTLLTTEADSIEDPLALLLQADSRVRMTMVGGAEVHVQRAGPSPEASASSSQAGGMLKR